MRSLEYLFRLAINRMFTIEPSKVYSQWIDNKMRTYSPWDETALNLIGKWEKKASHNIHAQWLLNLRERARAISQKKTQ